ncbi:Uncharacterised protein [Mycobacteroides abscessus subsp. abscessus]|uniref:hypothetical protein n=1 Tax=Mycobacteroides abscessus TaxID=36809 RepID=UPI0009A787AF|nr:hypothetical protein [Mycobacteroides abscessus]SLJ41000.1 Uncharacterised protein [Mycobacteroides abscessus subsp. abscessus]
MNDPVARHHELERKNIEIAMSELSPMERLRKQAAANTNTLGYAVFLGLQRQSNTYAGTVPVDEVQRRRRRNRAARKARRRNRSS